MESIGRRRIVDGRRVEKQLLPTAHDALWRPVAKWPSLSVETDRRLREDAKAQAKVKGEIVGLDSDPFLASYDPCERYEVGTVTQSGEHFQRCDDKTLPPHVAVTSMPSNLKNDAAPSRCRSLE